MTTRLRLTLGIAIGLAGLIGAHLLAVDGPITNALNLRVRTDANNYLMASSGTYTGADGPITSFANLRLRTDANNYLIVTYSGTQAFGAITATSIATTGSGDILSAHDLIAAAARFVYWTGRAVLGSPADAQLTVTNNAATVGVGLDVATDAVLKVQTRGEVAGATVQAQSLFSTGVAFAALGTPTNGTITFCTDCTETTPATCPTTQASCVCTNGGGGAFARRVAATWYCTF